METDNLELILMKENILPKVIVGGMLAAFGYAITLGANLPAFVPPISAAVFGILGAYSQSGDMPYGSF